MQNQSKNHLKIYCGCILVPAVLLIFLIAYTVRRSIWFWFGVFIVFIYLLYFGLIFSRKKRPDTDYADNYDEDEDELPFAGQDASAFSDGQTPDDLSSPTLPDAEAE